VLLDVVAAGWLFHSGYFYFLLSHRWPLTALFCSHADPPPLLLLLANAVAIAPIWLWAPCCHRQLIVEAVVVAIATYCRRCLDCCAKATAVCKTIAATCWFLILLLYQIVLASLSQLPSPLAVLAPKPPLFLCKSLPELLLFNLKNSSLSQLTSPLTGAIAKSTAASTTHVAASWLLRLLHLSQKYIDRCCSHRSLCRHHSKATTVPTNDVTASWLLLLLLLSQKDIVNNVPVLAHCHATAVPTNDVATSWLLIVHE